MDDGSVMQWRLCDIHKQEAVKMCEPLMREIATKLGGDPEKLRTPWHRIVPLNNH